MRKGLKFIAVVEGAKGVLSLIAGLGLHRLASDDVQNLIEHVSAHLLLNPASKYSGVVLRELSSITYSNLTLIAVGACIYSVTRLIEAYGLWNELAWVEWFALLSGAIYIPLEVYEIFNNAGFLGFVALAVNITIVWYLFTIVRGRR